MNKKKKYKNILLQEYGISDIGQLIAPKTIYGNFNTRFPARVFVETSDRDYSYVWHNPSYILQAPIIKP